MTDRPTDKEGIKDQEKPEQEPINWLLARTILY